MNIIRLLMLPLRIAYKAIMIMPKLQQAGKYEKHQTEQARIQQKMFLDELSKIPKYRDMLKRAQKRKGQRKQTQQELIKQSAQKRYAQQGKQLNFQPDDVTQVKIAKTSPAKTTARVVTGFEDYPLLHEIISS